MPTDDPQGFHERLERQRDLLANSETVHDVDRDAIRRYLRRKDGNIAVSSLKTYLMRLRRASEISSTPLVEFDADAFRDWRFELRHSDLGRGDTVSDHTMQSYENIVLQFLEVVADAEWAEDITRTTVENDTVSEEDILLPEDIETLLDAARYQRDVALIEFFADTAARVSLVCSLRVKDVDLDGERATYTPNREATGLKGAEIKPYPIIDGRASLRSYLRTSHPRPDDPEAALFHKLRRFAGEFEDDGGLDPSGLRNHLTRLADRAGVEKPTNPHNFRHSAITRMFREGFTKQQIQHRVHWEIDTAMWDRYVHITAEELNDDIFAAAGVVEPDGQSTTERSRCGLCNEPLAPHHRHCPNCGEPVSEPRRELLQQFESWVDERIVASNDQQERLTLLEGKRYAKANPEAIPDLVAEFVDDHS